MDRQKSRVGRSIDGFNQVPRPNYFIDGISRSPQPTFRQQTSQMPPQPTSPVIKPQVVGPGINRSQTYRPNSPNNEVLPTRSLTTSPVEPISQPDRSSILGSALPSREYARQARKPKSKWRSPKRIAKTAGIVFALLVLGFGGWFGSSILGSINKVFHGNVFSDAHALISGSTLKESGGRVNILLAGDSVDDPNHGGAVLADSIMVLSFNPQTKSGFILSIPRDLWVDIPSMGHQKINAANAVSNFNKPGYPSGGMGQLEEIVQQDLGIPIDYYALIDYTAFKDAVNAVGGITINIQSPDPRGIYDAYTHLKLPNGEVTLSGQQALDLARARGDNSAGDVSYGLPNSDFSRTQHQRQMLVALFKKATTLGVISNPLKVTSLFSAFGNNVKTDLSLGDVTTLLRSSGGINLANMTSLTYSYGGANSLLTSYTDPKSGQEALIPRAGIDDFTQLQQYYLQLSSSNPVVREAPTVTLLNASKVVGLASQERQVLENKGFNVVSVADATSEYPSTLIVDNSNGQKPSSLSALKSSIKGQIVTSTNGSTEASQASNYTTDFVVVLGQDWDNTQANSTPVQN